MVAPFERFSEVDVEFAPFAVIVEEICSSDPETASCIRAGAFYATTGCVTGLTDTMTALSFLEHGGQMGSLMRAKDWSQTPLGRPENWPASLRTAVAVMLRTRQPMFIGWGPQLTSLYNDGYIPICGKKHPDGLGVPMSELWSEIWDSLEPINALVLAGEAQWSRTCRLH